MKGEGLLQLLARVLEKSKGLLFDAEVCVVLRRVGDLTTRQTMGESEYSSVQRLYRGVVLQQHRLEVFQFAGSDGSELRYNDWAIGTDVDNEPITVVQQEGRVESARVGDPKPVWFCGGVALMEVH